MRKLQRRGIGSVEWLAFLAVLAIVGIWLIGYLGGRPTVPFESDGAYPAGQLLPEDRAAAELLDGPRAAAAERAGGAPAGSTTPASP